MPLSVMCLSKVNVVVRRSVALRYGTSNYAPSIKYGTISRQSRMQYSRDSNCAHVNQRALDEEYMYKTGSA